jgi:DNA helicase-2/ATP-dependent DNA helicase PcrA
VDNLDETQGSLTLMTLHNAKGLEFDCIIMAGLEEGLCPHHTSLDKPDELEEERRLFYVGMTRARKYLYLSFASLRRRMGMIEGELPSRFLGEIPEHLLEGEVAGVDVRRSVSGEQLLFGDEAGRPGGGAPVKEAEDYSQEEVVYAVGGRVYHQEFGKGIIRKVDGSGETMRVTVLFDGGGERKFVAKFTPMRPL